MNSGSSDFRSSDKMKVSEATKDLARPMMPETSLSSTRAVFYAA